MLEEKLGVLDTISQILHDPRDPSRITHSVKTYSNCEFMRFLRIILITLARCREILSDSSVTIRSSDPRLQTQQGVLNVRIEQP